MPKKIDALPIEGDTLSQERLDQAGAAAQELNALQVIANDNARAVALQVGYEGSMAVDALVDEIRFYQRQTVEACLQLGRRLLVLKEFSQIGKIFEERLDELGISKSSAYRFMGAALKTAKSANLSLLSGQVKSVSAFLELVTHDDDVIENLAEMDDIERMSASELRAKCRELKAEHTATEEVLAKRNAQIDKLERKKGVAAPTNWEGAFKPLFDQQHVAVTQIALKLGDIKNVIDAAVQVQVPEGEETSLNNARTMLANKVLADLEQAKEQVAAALHYFDRTLDGWL